MPAAVQAQGPGAYNFLDSLVVGKVPNNTTGVPGQGLTLEEARSHMSLWVAMASPLMLSLDLRTITPEVKEILTNEEILAVHKDSLAKMASRVDTSWFSGDHAQIEAATTGGADVELLERPLANGDTALLLLNRDEMKSGKPRGPRNISLYFSDLGDGQTARARRGGWRSQNLRKEAKEPCI